MYRTVRQLIKDQLRYFPVAVLAGYYKFKNAGEGRAMGLFWEFAKPLVFSLAMGIAMGIGMRQAKNGDGIIPYLEWLFVGYFAWNLMSATLGWGPRVFVRHKKLAQQRIVPLTLLPIVSLVKPTIVFLIFLTATCILGVLFGVGPFLAWVQLPLIIIIMEVYWYFFAIFTASIGTISKDFTMLVAVLRQPFFWTSGVIFNVANTSSVVFKTYLALNPFSFFITAYRRVVHDGEWIFADANFIMPFVGVFVVTALLAFIMYHRLKLEIRNELK